MITSILKSIKNSILNLKKKVLNYFYPTNLESIYEISIHREKNQYLFLINIKNPCLFLELPKIQEEITINIQSTLREPSILNLIGIQHYQTDIKSDETYVHSFSSKKPFTNLNIGDFIKILFINMNKISKEQYKNSILVKLKIKMFIIFPLTNNL